MVCNSVCNVSKSLKLHMHVLCTPVFTGGKVERDTHYSTPFLRARVRGEQYLIVEKLYLIVEKFIPPRSVIVV